MKLHSIEFIPRAVIVFSDEELSLLSECSESHYDARCKMASKPDGFLSHLRNANLNAPERGHLLDFDKIDTLAKIAEVGRYLGVEKGKEVFGLSLKLHQAMNEMREVVPDAIVYPE